jgi:hypothetical protein
MFNFPRLYFIASVVAGMIVAATVPTITPHSAGEPSPTPANDNDTIVTAQNTVCKGSRVNNSHAA